MTVEITRRTAMATAAAALPVAGGLSARERHHVFVYEEAADIAELVSFIIARNLDCDVTWMSGDRSTALALLRRRRGRFTISVLRESEETEMIFRRLDGKAEPAVLPWPMTYGRVRDSVLHVAGTAPLPERVTNYQDRVRAL